MWQGKQTSKRIVIVPHGAEGRGRISLEMLLEPTIGVYLGTWLDCTSGPKPERLQCVSGTCRMMLTLLVLNTKEQILSVSSDLPSAEACWGSQLCSHTQTYLPTPRVSTFPASLSCSGQANGYSEKRGTGSLESPCNTPRTPLEGHDL